ncbi:hypothetical protein DOV67_20405 [Salmonella enterica subsp. enterica serovar Java]|uniref:Uncharacterized protein n=3 Tax=Salmonella enterica TaxID=28901 RepID=A0A403K513_SALER|nr:hypothetical protein [Salmonella enterica subsp. enterica serovar Java]EBR8573895.1 hypothetical protein [Salmonella enterica subsp. enterica serovar Java]ECS8432511.1 hypothetical protein [Salmonella enterica]MLE33307.1 hypothetical protein [Salmonella enterica]
MRHDQSPIHRISNSLGLLLSIQENSDVKQKNSLALSNENFAFEGEGNIKCEGDHSAFFNSKKN